MKQYTKPPIKKTPNSEVVIIHTGTTDLSRDSTPTEIAANIMDLAVDVKKNLNRSCDVLISSIFQRGDHLQQKAFNLNKELKGLCASKNIRYIEHGKIHPRNYLNWSKVRFNFHGNTLILNICKFLECKQIFDCGNEKEGNAEAKTDNSNEKTIMLIVIARILKVLAMILLNATLLTKMILKILIVTFQNSVLTMTLQIRQILIQ